MGQPSSLQNVDDRGYVFVTEAADCQIVSKNEDVGTTVIPLPTTPLAGRRRMYIKNNHASQILYVGGADVTSANGYQVSAGDELVLDVTDDIIVYGVASAASTDTRILELA